MRPKTAILVSMFVILVSSPSILGDVEASSPSFPSPVVSTAWLAERLSDPDLVVLHIGQQGSFEAGHIPGARSASLRRLITVNEADIRDEMPPATDIGKALSDLGINDQSRVVVYFADESIAWAAARYLLTLEYVGMADRAAYLDGGLPGWVAEERPVSTDVPSINTTSLEVAAVPDVLVETEWLYARLEDPGIAVVDGRPPEGFSGVTGHWERLGHIPGAGNIPFFDLLAEEPPFLLKSREELSKLFREAGVRAGDTVVVYCGTGLWASLPYLAARHLDFEVRLYDGSYQEWSADKDLPVVTQVKANG